jgi:acetyl-CoA carboxylase biotin carboxyl carrier protein
MELTPADITQIVEAFEKSDWQHLRVSLGGSLLELSKSGPPGSPAATASPAADGAGMSAPVQTPAMPRADASPVGDEAGSRVLGTAEESDAASATAQRTVRADSAGLHEVVSPSVGVFWRAPSPSSPPFVREGDAVADADTVCIVEVMKLMNHVAAGVAGTIRSVLAENGQMVERGQVLFAVERAQ